MVMFLGCRGEANRPITVPSNWRFPVINFALISAHVTPPPRLLCCFPAILSLQSCGTPTDIFSFCLSAPLSPQQWTDGGEGGMERRENKRHTSKGLWLSD
ncbi:hypothetical protein ILYODFUR_006599 [Ilyodon furcidens]|uniref:Uncharacterized protein n=1 Tax=Ilyodon furcidens TaxID=33524 RepID=A0ABV0TJD6_9TELE